MKTNKKLVTYRFSQDLIDDIKTLSNITNRKQTTVVEIALSEYIMKCMLPDKVK